MVVPTCSSLLREDLKGFPPAYIVNVEQDPLEDDGIMYVSRLKEAGVEVVWKHYVNGIHGMFSLCVDSFSLEAGKQGVKDLIDYSRENLSF